MDRLRQELRDLEFTVAALKHETLALESEWNHFIGLLKIDQATQNTYFAGLTADYMSELRRAAERVAGIRDALAHFQDLL